MEFFNRFHTDPNNPDGETMDLDDQFPDGIWHIASYLTCVK